MKLDALTGAPCSLPVASVPLTQLDSQPAECLEIPDQKVNFTLQRHAVGGAERAPSSSLNLWGSMNRSSGTRCDSNVQLSWDKSNGVSSHYENGLFSSSLSELFSRKLRLSSNNAFYGHSVDTVASIYEEEEPFESIEEIEAQTIGNLLPNDDDLLSGVVDRSEHLAQPTGEDDIEDLDLFSNVGGMDLGDNTSFAGQNNSNFPGNSSRMDCQLGGTSVSLIGEHPYGEHPSRTLFVRNINSNVEDSELRALFQQYGDIRTLYTACKHRGFVMISYYDIRAARNAMKTLQNKPLRRRSLDIHYSIPKDIPSEKDVNHGTLVVFNLDPCVSNDDLIKIFGAYGDIKEIRETLHNNSQRFIEFYDVRAADEALHALNRSEIAGKKIMLEPSRPLAARQSTTQLLPSELELDEHGLYVPQGSAEFSHGPINCTSVESESGLGTNAGKRAPLGSFVDSSLRHGISSSVPSGLPSLFRAESAGKQPNVSESGNAVNQIQYDLRGLPTLHPNSLPEFNDGLATVSPCNSIGNMPTTVSSLPPERVEYPHSGRMSSSIEMGFGSPGNGSGPLAGHHYMWSNSKHPQPPAFMWPNSPSFTNGLCTPQPQHRLHGLARSPSHMMSSILPMNGSHVGSAPAVNPSIWDGRNSYPGGSPEASGFHPGPRGSMRLSGNHLHHMDFVSHNMFPHVGGNCMELPISSRSVGLHSPHQRCMMYPSRAQMNMAGSFEPPSERARSRRNESTAQSDNKKQYELDIERIRRGEDHRTTLMIKNIPNKYTSKMLMAAIDEHHRGTYNFIYLPIDFKNKCNVGYAFINMVDPSHIIPFYETFNGKKWEKFNSEKVASLAYARIQGKAALIAHFQNSSLMNEDKRCRPILFHSDGSNAGDQVPFPMGVNIQSRAGRSRSNSSEDNHQESSAHLANKEEFSNGDSSSSSG